MATFCFTACIFQVSIYFLWMGVYLGWLVRCGFYMVWCEGMNWMKGLWVNGIQVVNQRKWFCWMLKVKADCLGEVLVEGNGDI